MMYIFIKACQDGNMTVLACDVEAKLERASNQVVGAKIDLSHWI
jgi:hypothetical protein